MTVLSEHITDEDARKLIRDYEKINSGKLTDSDDLDILYDFIAYVFEQGYINRRDE